MAPWGASLDITASIDLWARFVETADPERQQDFYGLSRLAARTMFEAGEVLIRKIRRGTRYGLEVPYQLQVLEPDFLDSTKEGLLAESGNVVVQGVEYDHEGRRVAYWLFDHHPGELWRMSRMTPQSSRVPASDVIHMFEPLRPGQARGVGIFTPVALKMRDLDDYTDAALMQKKIAACFAGFIESDGGPAGSSLVGKKTDQDASGRAIEQLAPGMIRQLAPGQKMTFAQPPADETYRDFMVMELHAVAVGTGTTYAMLTGDLSETNYSSFRGGLIDFWELVDCWQWGVVIPQLMQPVHRDVMTIGQVTGKIRQPARLVTRWATPKRLSVDPQKDAEANKMLVRTGQKLLTDVIAETGEDPDAFLEQAASIVRQLDRLGLAFDSDGRRPANGPASASANAPQSTAA